MEIDNFIIFIVVWPIFALGYGGGIVYGLRFLRENELVDTRVPEFVSDTLFGKLGSNYKLFYKAHCIKYGKSVTRTLMVFHLISIVMVFATPIIFR